jgi:hypothetical protein
MDGLVLLDRDGEPVPPAIIWLDNRSRGELRSWRGDWAKESGGSELVSVEQQNAIVRRDPVERGQLRPQTSRRRAIRAQEPEGACFISRDHGGSTGAEAMGVLGGFDEFEDSDSVVHEEQAP